VVIAYMLTVALLIPASGWIADRFGTKNLLRRDPAVQHRLAAVRAVQQPDHADRRPGGPGPGRCADAAGRAAGGAARLSAFELVRIMGFITIPGLLGPLLGPTMGGWMVEYLTWHWIFLINLPVG
jgi:MFS family permease